MTNEENARLYRLECKVDFLFQRMGIDPEVALVRDSDGLGGPADVVPRGAAPG